MNDSSARRFIPPYRCSDCGSEVGFRSRRRTLSERFLLPLFLLQRAAENASGVITGISLLRCKTAYRIPPG